MASQLDSLRVAVQHSPDNVPLLLHFGDACVNELQMGEARETFLKILRLQSGNAMAKLGLARVVQMEGKTSEAAVRVEQLIEEQPECAAAYVMLSRILVGEGDVARAKTLYRQALELDSTVADAGLEKELAEGKGSAASSDDRSSRKAGLISAGDTLEEIEDGDDSEPSGGTAYDLGFAEMEKPKMSFQDVGGMDAVKEEIRMKIIYPLQHAHLFKAYDKKVGGGVLMYGPPGCGKTMLAKATAGEIKSNFMALGLHQILDMWIGNAEKNLHEVFELARKKAPTVLFFDEVDALAADRRDLRQSAGRTLINQFLSEMDGADGDNEGVLILGATNAPWHIDSAFRRPGRFDRSVFIPPPDEAARASIIEVMAKKKPIGELDAGALAKKTHGYSGADLKGLFDLATEDVLNQAMKTGKVVPLNTKDLLKATAKHQPTTRGWFESAKNYAMYANQGGFYDDVLKYLGLIKK